MTLYWPELSWDVSNILTLVIEFTVGLFIAGVIYKKQTKKARNHNETYNARFDYTQNDVKTVLSQIRSNIDNLLTNQQSTPIQNDFTINNDDFNNIFKKYKKHLGDIVQSSRDLIIPSIMAKLNSILIEITILSKSDVVNSYSLCTMRDSVTAVGIEYKIWFK